MINPGGKLQLHTYFLIFALLQKLDWIRDVNSVLFWWYSYTGHLLSLLEMSIYKVYCQAELICCSWKCVSIVLVVCISVKGTPTVNSDVLSDFWSHKLFYSLTWWNMQRSCFFSSCPSLTSVSRASIFVCSTCSLYDIFSSSSATYNSNEREMMYVHFHLKPKTNYCLIS